MDVHLQYAAHVEHPISHHSEVAQLSVGTIGILVTITIIATGGAAGVVAISATAAGLAISAAAPVDAALPVEAGAGMIASGFPTVLLGNGIMPAARARADDTKSTKCHVDEVFEGSSIVMIGPAVRPMSRRGDRIGPECGGTISDGLHTLLVGGVPSAQGIAVDEKDSWLLADMKLAVDAIGGTATIAKGGIVQGGTQLAGVALSATGHEDAANLVKAGAIRTPDNLIDLGDTLNTGGSAISSAGKLISPSGSD